MHDFKIFGRVQIRLHDEWRSNWQSSAKVRGMLGMLLTRPGTTFPISLVIDWLWGNDANPAKHSKTLHGYVSRLRGVLKTMQPAAEVRTINGGYRLLVDRTRVDYHYVLEALREAQRAAHQGDHEQVCELLPEALALTEEPAVVDLATGPAESFRRNTLHNVVLPAHYTLMTSQLALGYPERVLSTLDEIQPRDDLNPTLAKYRIDALRTADRDREATDYFSYIKNLLQTNERFEEADELQRYYYQNNRSLIPTPRDADGSADKPPTAPRRLPPDLRDFHGRDDLLATLDAYTNHGRTPGVIVLTGMAGIGKTALAVHWAHQVRSQFPDGYFWLDLQGHSRAPMLESADLARTLLQAWATPSEQTADSTALWARLSALISDRHMLFILDNVADPRQIAGLIENAPECVVVVTSRRHHPRLLLHLGAREIHVPTLTKNIGRQLLRANIGKRYDNEPDAFADLVELCGGFPLALHLIGQYANERPHVPLSEMSRSLNEQHRILTIGRTASDSDSSIRATFELSYAELPPSCRRMFRLVGLHPTAEITIGVATALANCSRETAQDDLDTLIDSHLIQQTAGHYNLHDLLHQFSAELSESQEQPEPREQARGRMLDWYLYSANNAERLLFPYRQGVPMPEPRNDSRAQEFTGDQDAMDWFMRERSTLIAAVYAASSSGYHSHTWRLANVLTEPLKRQCYYRDIRGCLELALVSAQQNSDRAAEFISRHNLGYILLAERDSVAAYDYFSSVYDMWQEVDQSLGAHGAAVALHNMAFLSMRRGDLRTAEKLFTKALQLQQAHNLDHVRAGTLRRLGQLRRQQGDLSQAHVYYRDARDLHRKVGNTHGVGEVLSDLSQLYLDRADYQTALDYGHEAAVSHQRSQDLTALAETYYVLAEAHSNRQELAESMEYARKCIRICRQTYDSGIEARALNLLSSKLLSAGHRDAAVEGWTRARDLYRGLNDQTWIAIQETLAQLGDTSTPHPDPVNDLPET